jgi:hypothetical protein
MLLAGSLPFLWPNLPAQGQAVIPADVSRQMTKGKKLELVWSAPDFDGSKGLKLGQSFDETEAGNAGPVLEYLPLAMQKLVKPDSPYQLNLTVISLEMKERPSGQATARIEVEGQLLEAGRKVVAAFTAYAADSSTRSARDNARLALHTIAFAMAKDLFSADMLKTPKASAIIVPVPGDQPAAPAAPGTAPVAQPPGPSPAGVPAQPAPAVQAPAAKSAVPAQPLPAPVAKPAAPAQPLPAPAPLPPLFTAETAAGMQRGKALGLIWTSPDYDRAAGFSLGEVRYEVETRNDGIDQYLPDALKEISSNDSPNVLEMRITNLTMRTSGRGASNVTLGIDGRIRAKDGKVLAAFSTRENVTGTGDLVADCRGAARRVVLAIVKDLK